MSKNHYTSSDYYSAALTRQADLAHLRTNPESVILTGYCAGLAIECMFRAYIVKSTNEFDAKHNLEKLFEQSGMAVSMNPKEKEKLTLAVKKAGRIWSNDLRYSSEIRMKRKLAHEIVNTRFKNIGSYLKHYFEELFTATDTIIEIGKQRWT